MAKKEQRALLVSDVMYLERILGSAHYNSKATLVHLERGFKGVDKFPMPRTTLEESKQHLINNLIMLRERLNELELGEIQRQDNNVPF